MDGRHDLSDMATRTKIVRRINAGFIPYTDESGRKLRILPLSEVDLYEAELAYEEAFDLALNSGAMTEDDHFSFLLSSGFTLEDEKNLTEVLPKHIEEFCVQIFQSVFQSETRERTRKYLAKAREELNRLSAKRYEFYSFTAQGVAEYARTIFIIERGLHLFDPAYKANLAHAYYSFFSHSLTDSDLRYISRKSPWSEIWSASRKANLPLFKEEGTTLSSERQRLILWSSMYDSIRECPDSPDDSIFDDDDAMDGWLILQRRKSSKAKLESEASKYIKNPNAGEIFVVAETPEDAKRINDLNSEYAKSIKKNRMDSIQKKGEARDIDFKDVRQGLQQQATQQLMRRK